MQLVNCEGWNGRYDYCQANAARWEGWVMSSVALSGQAVQERGTEQVGGGVLRSQVACAVLGLVIEKPSHGYEIGQRFERRFGGFLRVGRSSIYAALGSLMEAELIEKMATTSSTGVSRGAKAGAAYRATADGAR